MILALALALATSQTDDDSVRDYMLCVRRAAVRLEPSEASPEDVAKAAVFSCQTAEARAFNMHLAQANQLRETAIFYGVGQAVAARLCRRTRDCDVVPLPR